jgi:mono/diheme cytochrome c family protein
MYRVSTLRMSAVVLTWLLFTMAAVGAQKPGGTPEGKAMKNAVPATAASVTAGSQLYMKNCSFCHGPKGLGDGTLAPKDTKPANLTDAEWTRGSTDGDIFLTISEGIPEVKMPAAKTRLMPNDIWNIVNFVRSIGPKTAAR